MTNQQHAREHAARELARRLTPVTTLKNPDAAAHDFINWMAEHDWRHVPRQPSLANAGTGAPPEAHADELAAVRERLEAVNRTRREAEARAALEGRTDP